MNDFDLLTNTLALSMGAAWASGINLYAAILMLGIGGATGNITLPTDLQVVQDPMVIGVAALMYFTEFVADKTPGVDTGWDAMHTFIRIPAGALLAASAVGDVSPAWEIAAGLVGGTLATASHAAKTGSRIMINTSPEPFSNWGVSLAEDVAVVGGLWAALHYPVAFLALLVVFLIFLIWFLPKLWRAIKRVIARLREFIISLRNNPGFKKGFNHKNLKQPPVSPSASGDGFEPHPFDEISRLKQLLDQGAINQEEFDMQKTRLLNVPLPAKN